MLGFYHLDEKKMFENNDICMFYLYSYNDGSIEMLQKYGGAIQNQLGAVNIFTYYTYEMIQNWGTFEGKNAVVDRYKETDKNAFDIMDEMKKEYSECPNNRSNPSDLSNPCVIIKNKKGSTYYIEIRVGILPHIEQIVRKLYHSLEIIIMTVKDGIRKELKFSEITKSIRNKLKRRESTFEFEYPNEDNSIESIIKDYLNGINGRYLDANKKLNLEKLGEESLGITKLALSQRFEFKPSQPFTKDEAFTIAFTMGMCEEEIDDFLIKTGNAPMSNSPKDRKLIEVLNKYLEKTINEIKREYDAGNLKEVLDCNLIGLPKIQVIRQK
jgi:hypothetical protein